jgi:hypothetical protein
MGHFFRTSHNKKVYGNDTVRNTNAASFFNPARAVNDPLNVRQGDLLVWMQGNKVKRGPGHVAVVESYQPHSSSGGNMRVVEATGNSNASPKLLDSQCTVEAIIEKDVEKGIPVMILKVKRHRQTGNFVAVMRY